MDSELKQILRETQSLLKNMQGDHRVKLSSFPYTGPTGVFSGIGFRLYVGTEGTLTYKDAFGVSATTNFTAGYHPTRFSEITSLGTALEVEAIY